MNRREFLAQSAFYPVLLTDPSMRLLGARASPENTVTREGIPEPHFPDRVHLFIWRNWELANADRLAKVIGTTPKRVLEIGRSMGLPKKPQLTEEQLRRIYITVIRQNWHILPEEQLIELLGWDRQHYEFTLKEDDFLWMKLGQVKPHCEKLVYEIPSAEARRRAAAIKQLVHSTFGPLMNEPGEPAFDFVRELSRARSISRLDPQSKPSDNEVDLRNGWALGKPAQGSGVPVVLVEEFQKYLHSSFGCEMNLAEGLSQELRAAQFSLDPSIAPAAGSFEVSVGPQEVRVIGRDLMGLRQAIYYLQDRMEARGGPYLAQGTSRRTTQLHPRYVYSYFALYGDPLMEEEIDPFPDGFLDKLARTGVNGVWLQAVLRHLAPSKVFPEFGAGAESRLRNLRRLVERASRYGVRIYFYLNEPRSMPAEFFSARPEMKGTSDTHAENFFAMCTSTPEVREWLSDSLAHVFSQVPGLGGIFTITATENLTNCHSHGRAQLCPRCSKRRGAEVIAEVIQTFRDGVRRSSSEADVIVWDWGWREDWLKNGADSTGVVEKLPQDVSLLSVSEWDQPINRGGFPARVAEYSISVVGPGPRATRHWKLAQQRGLSTVAKVQWSNTWEISAVPYIPVPNLIVQHCENLLKAGIQGLMVSWTVGGYPSPNFEAAKEFYFSPTPAPDTVLRQVALRRYGREAAPLVLDAWKAFSTAFLEFPMEGGGVVYHLPTQHGPANPLRLDRTGYKATMMLFPYDDHKAWVGRYPVEVVEKQIEKMATLWGVGLESFRKALARVPAHLQAIAGKDLGIAETCYLHFQSTANQIRFYRRREEWQSGKQEARAAIAVSMVKIAEEELQLARLQYAIARRDSTISYEASNHYYYRPLDLVEKVINCTDVIEHLRESS